MILRLCLVLAALLGAVPASAMVCTIYDEPLTQTQVEQYAAEVKEGYPAKYRTLLDAVKITLSDAPEHNLTLISGSKRSELVVPAGYLKTNCLLAMGAALFDDYAKEQKSRGKPVDFDLPECPGLGPSQCLLRELDKSLRRVADPGGAAAQAGAFRLMIEYAFKYAIAHEFGHVIADSTAVPRRGDYDAELEADLLALHTIAASRVAPLADTFLFGGQVLIDAAEKTASGSGPHEATICRARRSIAMRDRLIPPLMQVKAWVESENAMGKVMSQAAQQLTPPLAFAPAAAACSTKLPAVVGDIERDLKRLAATVGAMSPPSRLDAPQLAAIERIALRSPVGNAMRNSLHATLSVARVMRLRGALTGQPADAAERARLDQELAAIDRLPNLTDMASHEYRDFLFVRAFARFASAPAATAEQADELRREIDRAETYGQPHIVMSLLDAMSWFAAGDCANGMKVLLQVQALRESMQSRTELALATLGIRIEPLSSPFAEMAAYGHSLEAEGKPIPAEQCATYRREMIERARTSYGAAN